jgi:hypothetical protein
MSAFFIIYESFLSFFRIGSVISPGSSVGTVGSVGVVVVVVVTDGGTTEVGVIASSFNSIPAVSC